jgi:hypothetical protein
MAGKYKTATVNHLKEAGELKQPPPLICINRGGCPKTPITVNIINCGSWPTATVKATINRNLWSVVVGIPAKHPPPLKIL